MPEIDDKELELAFRQFSDSWEEILTINEMLENSLREKQKEYEELMLSYQTIMESCDDIVMRFDNECRHVFVNSAVEKYMGIKKEEFINKTYKELGFSDELCVIFEESIKQVFETGTINRIRYKLPNGYRFEWLLCPEIKNDKVNFVITTARNI